jgi:hypothetical protein
MKKKCCFLQVLALLVVLGTMMPKAHSQHPYAQPGPSVSLPSPTAASLAQYGAIPVNLNTGVPAINIPLATVQGRSLSVPISLSYHASGIKVDQYGSWVGLGWSLNAGGVITRSKVGGRDERQALGYWERRDSLAANPAWKTKLT